MDRTPLLLRRPLPVGAALWSLVVLPLAVLVAAGWSRLLDADRAVVDALHPAAAGSSAYVTVLTVLTEPGTSLFRVVVLVPVLVWAWRTGRARLGWLLVVAGGGIGPLTDLIKAVVGRVRPEFADPVVTVSSPSFPSGHSSGVVTLVGLLWLAVHCGRGRVGGPLWALGTALVLVVGATRVALGVHYPSDVVAGWVLGAGWVLLVTGAFGVRRAEHRDGTGLA